RHCLADGGLIDEWEAVIAVQTRAGVQPGENRFRGGWEAALQVKQRCPRRFDVPFRPFLLNIAADSRRLDGGGPRSGRVADSRIEGNLPFSICLLPPERDVVPETRGRLLGCAAPLPRA